MQDDCVDIAVANKPGTRSPEPGTRKRPHTRATTPKGTCRPEHPFQAECNPPTGSVATIGRISSLAQLSFRGSDLRMAPSLPSPVCPGFTASEKTVCPQRIKLSAPGRPLISRGFKSHTHAS